jgi:hypothetical protein
MYTLWYLLWDSQTSFNLPGPSFLSEIMFARVVRP